jgi:hypothetical protein
MTRSSVALSTMRLCPAPRHRSLNRSTKVYFTTRHRYGRHDELRSRKHGQVAPRRRAHQHRPRRPHRRVKESSPQDLRERADAHCQVELLVTAGAVSAGGTAFTKRGDLQESWTMQLRDVADLEITADKIGALRSNESPMARKAICRP